MHGGREIRNLPMRHLCLKVPIAVGIIWLTSSAAPGFAQTPEFGRVEFENDAITVVRVHMAAHKRTPMHDIASARLVIWLTDGRLRATAPHRPVNESNPPPC